MTDRKKVKVGYISLIQLNFRGDKQAQHDRSVKDLERLSEELDFTLYITDELIYTPAQAAAAAACIRGEGVDLLLVQNTSFASGFLINAIADAAPYIGLWAVPEQTNRGPLPQNSFCGINLNASILKEYLSFKNVKYKWFFGNADDALFTRRLAVTLRAISAVKNTCGSTVLHIGGTASGFTDFYFDERKLLNRFGVNVIDVEYGDIKSRAESYSEAQIDALSADMAGSANFISEFAKGKLRYNAMVYQSVWDTAAENGASAVAMSCWPRFRQDWGFTPCAVFGRLNENGLITACEGDVLSAVSMLLLKHAADFEPILMDLVSFDRQDDTMQLWHCGVGSCTYAKGGSIGIDTHFNPGPKDPEKGWLSAGPVATMNFAPAPFTCMRLTRDCDAMMVFSGDIIDKQPTYHGSSGWIANLSHDGSKLSALDLTNTIMAYGFQHHYPLVRGDAEAVIMEIAAWKDITVIENIEYRDYLQLR